MSPEPNGDRQPSRLPLYVGVILVILGWTAIGLGWYQAGLQDLETGQIPYLISGGFGGFGLLLMGVVAILADVVRQAEAKLRHSANELHGRMEEIAESFVAEQSRRPRSSRRSAAGAAGSRDGQSRKPGGRTGSGQRRRGRARGQAG